ncbi:MAG: ABC transporter substrate-binding protein [Pseudomonadales bacterium]|jgi:TRAP-type mannitol/chloroaromatic compound transport system substrate-binding protein|nr:ABC transporter substrate-binding protein [Pseudomonadales bacterium]MBP76309.1 ABC transporter substrate-binding protein [Pseudomonadales bacterium]MCK5532268.1 TRAP transporter substrate-binding protein [Halopseudomonas aestusnigri]MEE2800329.1 TRAP transporter substrate-binding protein [Pseudomonadota bacterium]HAF91073.1 ABC transporter substrate-binding protein [Pseudomonas sp.]|tara:strand:+ start:24593 stop:25693 length:1101 start_codon:yes stop_codon:yes gene_type:complete
MDRRELLTAAGLGLGAAALAGCKDDSAPAGSAPAAAEQRFRWKMVTSWPENFPGLGTTAQHFADTVERLSNGRLSIQVFAAGALVPALEVFDAVSGGTAELGHSAAYYWKGKSAAAPFFTAVPFGMNAQEMNAWLYEGGGLALWQKAYDPLGVVPLPCGNTGVQMAGWFNKEINSLDDLQGLKIRMPGFGGEVLSRAGATTVNLPGSEIFTSLQTGVIDATDWVSPYNDLAFGLHKAAQFYYYPGWQEPCAVLELTINKQKLAELPDDLRSIVINAARSTNQAMLDEYGRRNAEALHTLVDEHNVQLRRLPDAVLERLRDISADVLEETAAMDPLNREVWDSMQAFREKIQAWHAISEKAMYDLRS